MNKTSFTCPPAPPDKKKYIADLGKILVKDNGKKKYYKPEEVKKAHKKSDWSAYDFSCWGMCTFSSHSDFDLHHQETGEVCDYTSMKATMLEGLSWNDTADLLQWPEVDLDTSWLDIGDLLGGFLEGIGDFFSSISEGLD
jgi:hypothetical protein